MRQIIGQLTIWKTPGQDPKTQWHGFFASPYLPAPIYANGRNRKAVTASINDEAVAVMRNLRTPGTCVQEGTLIVNIPDIPGASDATP